MRVLLVLVVAVFAKHHVLHTKVYGPEFDLSESNLKNTWLAWMSEYEPKYGSRVEEEQRFRIFSANMRLIVEHNSKNESYTLGLNQFADLTVEEFGSQYARCTKGRKLFPTDRTMNHEHPQKVFVPDSVDWSERVGYVTPVKNQEQCGSCWAFSATGCIESRSKIANPSRSIESLSEQELIDCSKPEGDQGCNGGLMDDAFKYVEKAGGLCLESAYPYTAKTGRVCKASQCQHYDPIKSYTDVAKDNPMALETAVADGPVSVAVEADQSAWQFYHNGVLKTRCGAKLDHGVLAVGYGTDSGIKYWKIKNSWGGTWGEHGYIRMCRECHKDFGKGECGILADPSFVTI